MAKNVNIHIKTPGARESKEQLNTVGQAAERVGGKTEQAGVKAKTSGERFKEAIGKMIGPLGLAAIAGGAAAAAVKVAKFFDDIKARADAAVDKVQGVRAAFDDLFEALDAFDEKSREAVTKSTAGLLQETAVPATTGLPIINAYTRQFKGMVDSGQLTQEQYQRGLKGMIGYGARHGGAATADLISIMAGWGITTPEQQGEFRRMIAAGAQSSGLTDAELIGALSRGMPTIKALGWTPQEAIESIGVLSAGEAGRKKTSLPGTTIQALGAPQTTAFEKYGIPEHLAEDPRQLLLYIRNMRATMGQDEYYRMLTKPYGPEGAAGVYKLVAADREGIGEAIERAAGPKGAAAEAAEERARLTTLESIDARAKAIVLQQELDMTAEEKYMRGVRDIGEAYQERMKRRRPISELWLQTTHLKAGEKEHAAYLMWLESLTDKERESIRRERRVGPYGVTTDPFFMHWEQMSAREHYESLTGAQQRPVNVTHNYNKNIIYNPVASEPRVKARVEPDDI